MGAAAPAAAPTETVTVTPSATPGPTTESQEDLDAWAQKVEDGYLELHGSFQEQCDAGDFPTWPCFAEGIGQAGPEMLTMTLNITVDKVPGLEIPLEKYRETQAHEVTLDLYRSFTHDGVAHPWPEQIRVYNAEDGEMIGFSDSDNGGLMEWYGFYDD